MIEDLGDEVTAHFADGTSAEGALLVGADGVHSAARKHIFPRGPEPEYLGLVATGGFPLAAEIHSARPADTADMYYIFGPNGFFGYSGGDAGQFMWWVNLPRQREHTNGELRGFDWSAAQGELLDRFKWYRKPIEELIFL
jgi:2-polyprenyl-6-methoxyphenol hydroxylase-like FAD-dependent oxidoreductase